MNAGTGFDVPCAPSLAARRGSFSAPPYLPGARALGVWDALGRANNYEAWLLAPLQDVWYDRVGGQIWEFALGLGLGNAAFDAESHAVVAISCCVTCAFDAYCLKQICIYFVIAKFRVEL